MRYFRNSDVITLIKILLILAVVCIVGAFVLGGQALGWPATAICALFSAVAVGYALWRSREIEQLANYLRRIADGEYTLDVRDNREGELSILKSEIYKVTAMLSEYNERLQAEKTAQADAMADISHQLRTPLTSMLVMADLLRDEHLPADKREEFLGVIRRQLERIQWLTSTLLKMAQLDAGVAALKIERVELSQVIGDAFAPLLVPAEVKGQQLTASGFEGVTLVCDRRWTAEALVNILKNCIEHTGEGGYVRVQCRDNPIFTEIAILDNGEGIDKADLPHIFQRFYRGKQPGEDSVGIGLAMAQAVIARQGGTVSVASQKGKGSCFTIRFYKMVV